MTTGREVAVAGERGVYDAFRHEFPRLDHETLRVTRPSGGSTPTSIACCSIPSQEPDAEIARQLGYVNTFGGGMYPLVMRAYRDHARGAIGRDVLHRRRSSTCSRCCCAARSSA